MRLRRKDLRAENRRLLGENAALNEAADTFWELWQAERKARQTVELLAGWLEGSEQA